MAGTTTTDPRLAALAAANEALRAAAAQQRNGSAATVPPPAADHAARRATPLARRSLRQRALHAVRRPPRGTTFAVWCGAVWALFGLADFQTQGLSVQGYVQARTFEVAPLADGRVSAVMAELQQEVEAGQVLVTLDDTANRIELQAATAELARLRAERAKVAAAVEAAARERSALHDADQRRFAADRDRTRLEILRLEAALAEDEGRLARLAPEGADGERAALARRIERQRTLLEEQRALCAEAERRADEAARAPRLLADAQVELGPLDQAIAAQQARVEQLKHGQRELVLRAPTAGRVAAIVRRPGEVVRAGEAVLTVVEREPSAVVAHVPEEVVHRIALGTEVVLYRQGKRGEAFESVVMHTGFEAERIPRRADSGSLVPRWGFPVHLACPPGRGIVAGEAFTVQFRGLPASATPSMP